MYEFMNLITLRATFSSNGTGTLPAYLGSTIRGILGHCFREFVCHTPTIKCFLCEKRSQCSYVQYFSSTGGQAGAVNPFVLHVLTQGKTEWNPGDECIFDITLFGNAAEHAMIYMDAILSMERKGWGASRLPFTIKWITDPHTGTLIYGGGSTWFRNLVSKPMNILERPAQAVRIAFDTPVRIESGGKLFHSLPFEMLIRFLSRRFSLVSQAYSNYQLEWEQKEFLEEASTIKIQAQEWRKIDFTRYSINQKDNKLDLPAQIGWVLYSGDLSKFIPLLEAGKYLHVGRNTTIGFGHYGITYDR